jgi:hypothetical protein
MVRVAFVIFLLGLAAPASALQYSFIGDGGYLYSRWEYQSSTSTFSLLSKSGSTAHGYLTAGTGTIDLLVGGGSDSFQFSAPSTRILGEDKITATSYLTGLRFKTPFIWTTLSYQSKEILYLIENSTTSFDLAKARQGFGVLGLTLFGWGAGYRITLDGEIGVPSGKATTDIGELGISYFTRGIVRVEFGNNFRIGIMTGIENQDYTITTATETIKLYRSDFVGGLTIAIGAGKSSKSGRSGGSSWGSSNASVPNYPL